MFDIPPYFRILFSTLLIHLTIYSLNFSYHSFSLFTSTSSLLHLILFSSSLSLLNSFLNYLFLALSYLQPSLYISLLSTTSLNHIILLLYISFCSTLYYHIPSPSVIYPSSNIYSPLLIPTTLTLLFPFCTSPKLTNPHSSTFPLPSLKPTPSYLLLPFYLHKPFITRSFLLFSN